MAKPFADMLKVKVPVGIFNGYKLEGIRYKVEYIEEELNALPANKKICLRSPVFPIGNNEEYQARIICYFKGGCDYVNGCKSDGCSYVQFKSRDKINPINIKKVDVSYHTKCPNGGVQMRSWLSYPAKEIKYFCEDGYPTWGSCWWTSKPDVSTWLINGTLTLICDITLHIPVSPAQVDPDNKLINIPQKQLVGDISSLLGKEELSDVNIEVGGEMFKAHKVILSARSPVFAKMFQTEMSENKLSVVEITDMTYNEVQSLLVYVYTDMVDGHAEPMLAAADKYQMEDLKDKCEGLLAQGLSVQNSVRLFLLADLHRARTLKAKAVDFIKNNTQKVSETEDWKLAKQMRPLEMAAAFL